MTIKYLKARIDALQSMSGMSSGPANDAIQDQIDPLRVEYDRRLTARAQAPWWLRFLLNRVERMMHRRDPDRVIETNGSEYMRRWFVIPKNNFFNVYAHEIMRSDDARALHDHPWANLSIVLDNEYTEHTISEGGVHCRAIRAAGAIKLRGLWSAHRIELHKGPVATLFITGPAMRMWGWHCPNGWRSARRFNREGCD